MKLAVMASGSGSILRSIIDAGLDVQLVITDKRCEALAVAAKANVPFVVIDRTHFCYAPGADWDRGRFTDSVRAQLEARGIDLVAMAGFMTVLHPGMFARYDGWILNIHPSLLPAFKGEHAVRDALHAGVTTTGSTVHIATERLDDERFIVDQVTVPVLPGDTVDVLWERIKVQERLRYPRVLRAIMNGCYNLDTIKENA